MLGWLLLAACSMTPVRRSTSTPASLACSAALRAIVSLRSTPMTLPVGPTPQAAMIESSPAPLPRSRIVSPSAIFAPLAGISHASE
jgi:hypothetical protein